MNNGRSNAEGAIVLSAHPNEPLRLGIRQSEVLRMTVFRLRNLHPASICRFPDRAHEVSFSTRKGFHFLK